MLTFSIVTASYNQGRYLQKCIDSVRQQFGVNIEHIILDNCSTDATGEQGRAYQAQPEGVAVTVIVEPDKGQTPAINRGFKLATGEVVCWLNTDEYYHPGALAAVAEYFGQHLEVDVVFGDCEFVDEAGQRVKRKQEFGFDRNMLLYYGCFLPSCATFVRRRVLDEGYFLDEAYRVCMDFEWYTRLAFRGYQFAHLPQVLASFTWHDENISTVQKMRRLEERFLVQDFYSRLVGPVWFKKAFFRIAAYYWIMRRTMWRIGRRIA